VERLDCLRPDLAGEVAGRVDRFLGSAAERPGD